MDFELTDHHRAIVEGGQSRIAAGKPPELTGGL
jgi:hypothetical protein